MNFDIEYEFGFPQKVIAGIDEAGRGCWAGPVVAACVILPHDYDISTLNDSKKLTPKKRFVLYEQLRHLSHGIGQANVNEIEQLNILQASLLAMKRAYEVLDIVCDEVLIDGNQVPSLSCSAHSFIGGDGRSPSIAAASILAKVTRDNIMCELHQENPFYSWQKNKGYGVKAHQEGLIKYGVNNHHRKTFAPIRKILDGLSNK